MQSSPHQDKVTERGINTSRPAASQTEPTQPGNKAPLKPRNESQQPGTHESSVQRKSSESARVIPRQDGDVDVSIGVQ